MWSIEGEAVDHHLFFRIGGNFTDCFADMGRPLGRCIDMEFITIHLDGDACNVVAVVVGAFETVGAFHHLYLAVINGGFQRPIPVGERFRDDLFRLGGNSRCFSLTRRELIGNLNFLAFELDRFAVESKESHDWLFCIGYLRGSQQWNGIVEDFDPVCPWKVSG